MFGNVEMEWGQQRRSEKWSCLRFIFFIEFFSLEKVLMDNTVQAERHLLWGMWEGKDLPLFLSVQAQIVSPSQSAFFHNLKLSN